MADQPSDAARFFGYAMIAVGVLMVALSGTCTLFFLTMSLQPYGDVTIVLAIGLPFIAIGMGFIFGGRALSRRRGPKVPPGDVF